VLSVSSLLSTSIKCFRLNLRIGLGALLFASAGLSYAAQADTLEKGEAAFGQCAGCHSIEEGGSHLTGPNLYAVFGRDIASAPDFRYSDELLAMPGVWDQNRLNRYIARPKLAVPGNKMPYPGLTSPHLRADLIKWLMSNPTKLTATRTQASILNGTRLASSCAACHSFSKGAANSIGPNLWGVVGRPIASVETFDYSERLMRRSGTWTRTTLEGFFTEIKEFEQGSHMAFRRLTNQEDRNSVISWLSTLSDEKEALENKTTTTAK